MICIHLSIINLITICILLFASSRLSQRHEETYMDSRNLATCLGPTLMWGPNELAAFEFTGNVNQVIESMILFQEDIFPKPEGNETEYSYISITEGKEDGG